MRTSAMFCATHRMIFDVHSSISSISLNVHFVARTAIAGIQERERPSGNLEITCLRSDFYTHNVSIHLTDSVKGHTDTTGKFTAMFREIYGGILISRLNSCGFKLLRHRGPPRPLRWQAPGRLWSYGVKWSCTIFGVKAMRF